MRILSATFFLVTLMVVVVGAADRAAAERYYPWCAELRDRNGMSTNCGFTSYGQCMATVRGVGGFCRENSFNRQWNAEPPRKRRYYYR